MKRQIEMAIISGGNIELVGTHIGVTIAADGPLLMALADVAFFRGMAHVKDHRGDPAVTVLIPSDAVSAYALTLGMADWPSASYLRGWTRTRCRWIQMSFCNWRGGVRS